MSGPGDSRLGRAEGGGRGDARRLARAVLRTLGDVAKSDAVTSGLLRAALEALLRAGGGGRGGGLDAEGRRTVGDPVDLLLSRRVAQLRSAQVAADKRSRLAQAQQGQGGKMAVFDSGGVTNMATLLPGAPPHVVSAAALERRASIAGRGRL